MRNAELSQSLLTSAATRSMEREHLQKLDVSWGHEPVGIPLNRPPGTFSPTGGEGWDEGVRFMESLLSLLRTHWDHEPLRLTEARSGPRVCDPQLARFMESLHDFRITHRGHEPVGIPLNRPPGTFSPTGGERTG